MANITVVFVMFAGPTMTVLGQDHVRLFSQALAFSAFPALVRRFRVLGAAAFLAEAVTARPATAARAASDGVALAAGEVRMIGFSGNAGAANTAVGYTGKEGPACQAAVGAASRRWTAPRTKAGVTIRPVGTD
ncbi:hypothetical protein [Methylobacterium sp. JK268]